MGDAASRAVACWRVGGEMSPVGVESVFGDWICRIKKKKKSLLGRKGQRLFR